MSPSEASFRPSVSTSISSISRRVSSERRFVWTESSNFRWLQPPGGVTFAVIIKLPADKSIPTLFGSTPPALAMACCDNIDTSSFVSSSTFAKTTLVTRSFTSHDSSSHVFFLGPQPSAMGAGADGHVLPSGQHWLPWHLLSDPGQKTNSPIAQVESVDKTA